ncbi:SGNH/GDSL hydrolase family protein [Nonomuraea fuscirosea]|uniref:SGNH/GDSL hydrolase family protein n=1 Tax=Nonomuraea fuscirosea TaxID=1291556 RepID=UPI003413833A
MKPMTGKTWLQHTHLDKLYGYLPGMADALPTIFGLSRDEYAEVITEYDARAGEAAEALLADREFAARLAALPVPAGRTILAIGDSITDDLQSWAEILRHLLRPRGVRVVNGGLSAHTTAMLLRRWPATLAAIRPDWVICALGGNDVTRIGPEAAKPQVSLSESVANLRELRRIGGAVETWVWLTPVPVREERVSATPAFGFSQVGWRNADIVALAGEVLGFPEPAVDLTAAFGVPARSDLQGEDGVHPSLDGQMAIVRALVERLTEHRPRA